MIVLAFLFELLDPIKDNIFSLAHLLHFFFLSLHDPDSHILNLFKHSSHIYFTNKQLK